MKTKEFISKMDDVAGATIVSSRGIHIYNLDRELIGWVSVDDFGAVDTSYEDLGTMKNKEEIVKLLFEYALTPLDKREDELKFRVRILPNKLGFLCFNKLGGNYFVNSDRGIDIIQTIFTKSEYDKLQQKYRDWLPRFDKNDPHFEIIGGKINER